MKMTQKAMDALKELGRNLPEHTSVSLCVLEEDGRHVCHRYTVSGGRISHSESHSDRFIRTGSGPVS